MIGVAAASASREAVFLAGLAGLTAGVMSMAAGEYVSVSSHRDAERADIERESTELAHHPASELRELVDLYVQRGLDADLAQKVAKQLTAADALETHMREELGLMPGGRARPVQAAVVSALSRSWEEVMSEAVGQSAEEAAITARRRELLLVLCRAHDELGRWPVASNWEHRTKTHATRRTYVRYFGSWDAACRAAARLKL